MTARDRSKKAALALLSQAAEIEVAAWDATTFFDRTSLMFEADCLRSRARFMLFSARLPPCPAS